MRLIFWLLLLLNLSFFYWQYSQPQKPDAVLIEQEVLPAGVERLVLLRERGLGVQKNPAVSRKLTVIDAASALTSTRNASEQAPFESKALAKEQQTTRSSASSELSAEDVAAPAAEIVSEKAPSVVMACFTVGPFKNEAAAGQMYKALLPLGIVVEQRLSERRVPKNYWVYLPPQKSYSEARQKVKRLQKQGLDDMFIMGKGEMKNAVSLGLFKRKSTATDRFNEVRRLDSSTAMKTQYRVTTQKWLDIKLDSAETEKLARIVSLVDDLPGIKLEQQKSCK